MPKHFLHNTQIRSAFEHVRRGRVAKGVRTDVADTGTLPGALDNAAHLALVDAPATGSDEYRILCFAIGQFGAPELEPLVELSLIHI